jgi:tetratricopeptide (TPR) repeat protein
VTRDVCPPTTELAALADGHLDAAAAREVRAHLARCEDCYEVFGELLAFRREEGGEQEVALPSRAVPRWALALAASVVVVIGVAVLWIGVGVSESALERLAKATAGERPTVVRIVGFEHAPPAAVRRGDERSGASWRLEAEAARLREEAETGDLEALHALGIAKLLLGESREAVEILRRAHQGLASARVELDLAAALVQQGIQEELPAALVEGLEILARLRTETATPEVLFNEALALEALDRPDEAREAWQRFLELEADGPWADEARERMSRLGGAAVR